MRGIHRWLAYLIALPFLLVGVTGVILVLRDPFDRLWTPELYATTPGQPALDAIRDAVIAHNPDRSPQFVRLPRDGSPAVIRLNGEPRAEVFIDPGSLAVLGERDPQSAPVSVLLDLHRRFVLGKPGDWLGGVVGILLLAALLTGTWLWWIAPRRWKLGIRPRFFTYDLHRLLGVVGLPLAVLIAVTGISMDFPDSTRFVLGLPPRPRPPAAEQPHAKEGEAKPREDEAKSKEGEGRPKEGAEGRKREHHATPPPSWDALLATAAVPDANAIVFPRKRGDPIVVRNEEGVSARIDPATGEVVGRTAGRDVLAWIHALHTGEAVPFAGIPLWIITGVAMLTLLVTGLWLRIARARRADDRT